MRFLGTIPNLIGGVARSKPRLLCCPECGGYIELLDGSLWCIGLFEGDPRCGKRFDSLRDLAVRGAA